MTPEEREDMLANMRACVKIGEQAYDDMYEAHSHNAATACYSDAKEAYYEAISLAGKLGLASEAEELTERLHHIKAVFRSQFT